MLSLALDLSAGETTVAALSAQAAAVEGKRAPDLVLPFLPADGSAAGTLEVLAEAWPLSPIAGCEAASQFAGRALTGGGGVELLWLERPGHSIAIEVLHGTHEHPPAPAELERLAGRLAAADAALLLADGLRFPCEWLLGELGGRLAAAGGARPVPVAGGLASAGPQACGAHALSTAGVLDSACLVLLFDGFEMEIEIVRGWDPASPVYTIDQASGRVAYRIDGAPATEWFRRFFTHGGALAPLPEAARYFPLLIEGPRPERRGLYRSMASFDDPPGAVAFWGDVQTGDHVRLGVGNDASLLASAAASRLARPPEAAVLFSCVGREEVLADRAGREVAAIHDALGGCALAGCFSHAEIGPAVAGGLAFHNQTALLATLWEDEL